MEYKKIPLEEQLQKAYGGRRIHPEYQRARRIDAEPMNLWDTSQIIGSVFRENKYLAVDVCAYYSGLFLHFIQFSMKRYCYK